jgi:hypothetical protein
MDESGNPREHFDVLVFPDSEILGTNTRFGKNCRCLRENERSPADGATAEMYEMPIVGKTVRARVLAHRRNDDPVAKQDVANLQAIEEHWAAPWSEGSRHSQQRKNSKEYRKREAQP